MAETEGHIETLISELDALRQRIRRLEVSEVRHRQAAAQFRALLESAPDAILIIDRDGHIQLGETLRHVLNTT